MHDTGIAASPSHSREGRAGPVVSPPGAAIPAADPAVVRWLLVAVVVLVIAGIGSCMAIGADRPADPLVVPAAATAGLASHSSPVSRVPGFGHIGFRVISARRSVGAGVLRCALLADNSRARAKGLMGRRDLAGYDAMIFRFGADSTDAFFNQGVPMALSVAWFDRSGVVVGTVHLSVCSANCVHASPAVPYRLALEVPEGGLSRLGIASGSALFTGGSCGG